MNQNEDETVIDELQEAMKSLWKFRLRTKPARHYGYHLSFKSAIQEWRAINHHFGPMPVHLRLPVLSAMVGEFRHALGDYREAEIEAKEFLFSTLSGPDLLAIGELGVHEVGMRLREAFTLVKRIEAACFVLQRCHGIPNPTVPDLHYHISTLTIDAAAAYIEGVELIASDLKHYSYLYPNDTPEESLNIALWSIPEVDLVSDWFSTLGQISGRDRDPKLYKIPPKRTYRTNLFSLLDGERPRLKMKLTNEQLWELASLLQKNELISPNGIGWLFSSLILLTDNNSKLHPPAPPSDPDIDMGRPLGDRAIKWLTTPTDLASLIYELSQRKYVDDHNIPEFVEQCVRFPNALNEYVPREKFRSIYKNFTSRSEDAKAKGKSTHRILTVIHSILGISK